MMNTDQAKAVAQVYRQFMAGEDSRAWTELDDYMEALEWLDNDQLHREADVIHAQHKGNNPRCEKPHDRKDCFVPVIVEAVGAILDLYKETGELHKNNKYILQCYLACNQAGMIVTD